MFIRGIAFWNWANSSILGITRSEHKKVHGSCHPHLNINVIPHGHTPKRSIMSTVLIIGSSIERATRVVRSTIKSVQDRKTRNSSMERQRSKSSNQNDSPSRKVFEMFFARPARRTVSFLRPGQQKKAEVQDEADKRLAQAPLPLLGPVY